MSKINLIISLEGKNANTENNVFKELLKISNFLCNDENEWFIISLDAKKKANQDYLISWLKDNIKMIDLFEKEEVACIFIIHDWDDVSQESSILESQKTLLAFFEKSNHNIINYKNKLGNKLNNIENELIGKLFKIPIKKEKFNEVINIKPKDLKKASFKDPIHVIMKTQNKDVYKKETIKEIINNLKNNESPYYPLIKQIFLNLIDES